jgi:hypothetical protein
MPGAFNAGVSVTYFISHELDLHGLLSAFKIHLPVCAMI